MILNVPQQFGQRSMWKTRLISLGVHRHGLHLMKAIIRPGAGQRCSGLPETRR